LSTINTPQTSDNYVGRIDHDFGSRFRWMTSYRYYKFNNLTTNQTDVGGVLPGDKFGVPVATAPRTQKPSYWVTGLTTTINASTTNDFRFSYTRNYWAYISQAGPPQLPGLGGALEIGGESSGALIPYNVNTQSTRTRFWDGQDKMLRDDVTMIKGKHLFTFGGTYQRNFDFHNRNDNGNGIDSSIVYQSTNGSGINFPSTYIPIGLPSNQVSSYENYYAELLGIVNQPQVAYTRAGKNLNLQPLGTQAFDQDVIPFYNLYFSDSWRPTSSLTLTFGTGYSVEMPPYELNGKQVELVNQNGGLINTNDYLAARQTAALAGTAYAPTVGFSTVGNVGTGLKYPYNPYYGGVSPRVAAAWNPNFTDGILGKIFGGGKTVVRGGYGRIYGRLNGVDLVLVPLLGTGLIQAVSCIGASSSGQCLGPGGVDPTTAFRIGTDGMKAPLPAVSPTLSQPYFPGLNGNAAAGDGEALDPNFRPSRTDNFTFSLQREINSKVQMEVGYIGRLLRDEYQAVNLDAVPYMTTLGGQSFSQAYANVYNAINAGATPGSVANQAFFESALGGANSSYCTGFGSCTAAVMSKLKSNFQNTQVYDIWSALNKAPSWTLGRTMLASPGPTNSTTIPNTQLTSIFMNGSFGYGNYNAAYGRLQFRDWHGLTAISNFTWGRALGTGDTTQSTSAYTVLDPWNMGSMYGTQSFDIKFIFNVVMYYQEPFFRNQKGILGHVLGGWVISPIFTAQSGSPLSVGYSESTLLLPGVRGSEPGLGLDQ